MRRGIAVHVHQGDLADAAGPPGPKKHALFSLSGYNLVLFVNT